MGKNKIKDSDLRTGRTISHGVSNSTLTGHLSTVDGSEGAI